MTHQLLDVMTALSALDSKTLASLSEDDLHALENRLISKANEARVTRTQKINNRIHHSSGNNNC